MSLENILPLLMFPTLLLFLMSGYPVAFVLGGVALIFAGLGYHFDVFFIEDLSFLPMKIFGVMNNFTLMAVPLFIFMGIMLEKSGIAGELLESASYSLRKTKGSLLFAVIAVGAILAASTGIVGATVVTMGVLTLPTMLDNNYDKKLSLGVIAASGTLGQIIPPSIVLILLSDMMNVDVGDMFLGALIPGFMLVALYVVYCKVRVSLNPELIPDRVELDFKVETKTLVFRIVPPLLLVLVVLGSILFGLASPTESASLGALGAIILSVLKNKFTFRSLYLSAKETSLLTGMVFGILIGAQLFGLVFRGLEGDELLTNFVNSMDIHKNFILLFLMIMLFFLGFFLDFMEICFIVIPIILPIFQALEFDILWLSILIAVNLQTSFLTPPFGFALFYLKGVAPKGVKTSDIYKGVIPFVAIQLVAMLILALFPEIVTFLPNYFFKDN